MSNRKIRLVIADDHPLVREGVKKVLSNKKHLEVRDEASNAIELFDILDKKGEPDLLVLDINMPGRNGLDVLKDLRQKLPKLPILILSMHPAERFAVRSLKAGAVGYITKGSITDELEKAIETIVVKRRKYISPEVAEKLAEEVDVDSTQPLHMKLSDREFQVMCMISSGKKVSEIAEELSLSVRTVHTYRKRMMDKMKLKTNVDVVYYALSHGIIDKT